MSRSATATPPQTYFPQKVATPSARHSAPIASSSHYHKQSNHHSKRNKKHVAGPSSKGKSSGVPSSSMEMSFEDVSALPADPSGTLPPGADPRSVSRSSLLTFHSVETDDTQDSMLLVPTPGASFYSAQSAADTPLVTPNPSQSLITPLELVAVAKDVLANSGPTSADDVSRPSTLQSRGSWTSNIGKMAKAVVHTGKSMGMSFGERKKRDSSGPSTPQAQPSTPQAQPIVPASLETSPVVLDHHAEDPAVEVDEVEEGMRVDLSMVESRMPDFEHRPEPTPAMLKQREMQQAKHSRLMELARLCSQWPCSGYQKSKFGPAGRSPTPCRDAFTNPAGSKAYYEPISLSNPEYVIRVMRRQADLEDRLSRTGASHFTCRRDREGSYSDDGSDHTADSYMSSQPSPASSLRLEEEQKTRAEIQAAMGESINDNQSGSMPVHVPISDFSLPTSNLRKIVKGSRSISELDRLATSMQLTSGPDEQAMEVDQPVIPRSVDSATSPRHERATSAGSKRPLQPIGPDEEKRRKVDEAMVVEEAVSTGVIMPSPPTQVDSTGQNRQMAQSTPDLSSTKAPTAPALFGHVVKTSDTHPIIISPFFPNELLSIIASNVVLPTPGQSPMMVSSQIDVAALLLAYTPNSSANSSALSSPVATSFRPDFERKRIGNLLLSSCPGKRLRMEGPVKGRPPVCRDLETDLRRIKSEGVGCLVCCLDDTELALLGVPWETYHSIATKTGLDVIRMPMPDGFTPVSVELFDQHVALICEKYTLEGINVLVHCRGGVGRAGLTASAWAIKMGFVSPHPSLQLVLDQSPSIQVEENSLSPTDQAELEHQVVMSMVERVIAMIRCRRGLKAIESFEQVQFLANYVGWLRRQVRVQVGSVRGL